MSKAKDDYYEFKKEADLHHEGLCDRSYEYIKVLEEKITMVEGLVCNCNFHLDCMIPEILK